MSIVPQLLSFDQEVIVIQGSTANSKSFGMGFGSSCWATIFRCLDCVGRCIVVIVVPPDLGRPQSRDTAAPRTHAAVSLRGAAGPTYRGAAFKLVSCFFLGKGRKPKRPGAELHSERTPARRLALRARSPPSAEREPGVPAAGGCGGGVGRSRRRWREPAAAAATAKWRRP